MKTGQTLLTLCLAGTIFASVNASQNPSKRIKAYQQQGASQINADRGKQLWYAKTDGRSCASCHGDNPANNGKHVKTRKNIKPMASSINPERYQDNKKIEKWFFRNCKWTFGRECNVQEKADILTWLSSQ